jgi:3-methyladenine DNA glycosylase AlkD
MTKKIWSKPAQHAFEQLKQLHEALSNPVKAAGAGAYMRNLFVFFGCDTNERRKHTKALIKDASLPFNEACLLVNFLWQQKEREYHYAAIEWMMHYKKDWTPDTIHLFEMMITQHSWWDTVDYISSKLVAEYFKRYPKQIIPVTSKWNQSDNIWLVRVSIIFQLTYKDKTNTTILFDYILYHSKSKEFFIQKAMGWALRQYARTNAIAVKNFVHNHTLPSLTVREALKHL